MQLVTGRKLNEARKELWALGLTLKVTDFEEYRVNYRGGKEATAYYTNDFEDAVGTGKAMSQYTAGR